MLLSGYFFGLGLQFVGLRIHGVELTWFALGVWVGCYVLPKEKEKQ